MEDIKIIELFFNRDETAIQELSNKYSGYCYKIVWNLLNNHEDVEECLNDTWLAAWEYIPPRRPSVLSAYVGKIARGFAIDCFRKKQAAKRMDEKIAEKELIKIIENFLRKLSDSDRDIFIRRYWYLDSIKDIAKRHGVSQGCIKTNLCRNRKKLYRILKREVLI